MKRYCIPLIAIFIAIYILPLAGRPLISPDEFRYAEIPREMLVQNNWVVPKLLNIQYFEKPIAGYWFTAVAMKIFGDNAFAIRLPAALATGLTGLLLFFFVMMARKDPEEALWSTALFWCMGLVYGVGTFAVLDAPTSLFLTATLVFFFGALTYKKHKLKQILFLFASGISVGLAFLTKGFIAFAVPAVAILAYLILQKKWREIFTLPWLPLFGAILIAGPWAIAIHLQEPDFWHYFFWIEHIQRFTQQVRTQHPEPFWFYLPVLIAGAMPSLLLGPVAFAACRAYWTEFKQSNYLRYTFCWLVFPILFFSASQGKIATYILPCFAPLAIILGRSTLQYLRLGNFKLFDVTVKSLAILFALSAVGFTATQIIMSQFTNNALYGHDEVWKWSVALVAAILWSYSLWQAAKARDYHFKLSWWVCAPLLTLFLSNYLTPSRFLEGKAQGAYLEPLKKLVPANAIIVAHPNVMHAVGYTFKNSNILLYTHGGELEHGLSYPENKQRIISKEEFTQLVSKAHRKPVVFVMRGDFREGIPKADTEVYGDEIMFSLYKNYR